jgi:hypothetical protein
MAKPSFVQPRFVLEDRPKMGWRSVYLANDAGMLLNTEPVCSYPVGYHPWFGEWLTKQRVPMELPDVIPPDPKALKEEAKKILDKDKKKP